MKCPFCGSEEFIPLSSSNFIRKKYRKTIPGMATVVEEGECIYQIKKYHEEKQYFIS